MVRTEPFGSPIPDDGERKRIIAPGERQFLRNIQGKDHLDARGIAICGDIPEQILRQCDLPMADHRDRDQLRHCFARAIASFNTFSNRLAGASREKLVTNSLFGDNVIVSLNKFKTVPISVGCVEQTSPIPLRSGAFQAASISHLLNGSLSVNAYAALGNAGRLSKSRLSGVLSSSDECGLIWL